MEAPDSVGYRPLHCAVCGGSVVLLSLLIQSGVEVDATCNSGATALHIATRRNAVDCVEVLLAAGAALDVRSDSGRTPLDLALDQNIRRVWPLLLRAGAEIPTNNTHPYIVRVRNAGGFKKYAQAHLARVTKTVESKLGLPARPVRLVVEFWHHAGYY